MLETQLLRSRNMPLVVSWRESQSVGFRLLARVLGHCGRWRYLRWIMSSPSHSSFDSWFHWLRPAARRLAQLERLEVVTSPLIPAVSRALDIFSITPALRQVVLTDRVQTVITTYRYSMGTDTHYSAKGGLGRQLEILKGASVLVTLADPLPPSSESRCPGPASHGAH
jgi:hypothetical protein